MIPRVNSQGYSFKGVTDYLMHDKKADTDERVEWTLTGNMYTDDIFKAAKVMAWTDMHAEQLKIENGGSRSGRKTETGSVYHYSLSWAHRETPNEEHQKEMALATLERLGLSENEYYLVAHNDTEHNHVHIVANLTNRETGIRTQIGLDKKALQAWALEYEKEHGIHCENRVLNAKLREQDGARYYTETQKARHSIQVTRAYNASDNGNSFKNAMELEGLQLARGRRFLLAVDDKGRMVNIAKVIDGHTTKDIKKKLVDLDRDTLPDVDTLAERIKADNKPYDRDAAETAQQIKMEEAANAAAFEQVEQEKEQEEQRKLELLRKEFREKLEREKRIATHRYGQIFEARVNEARKRHDIEGNRERLEDAKEAYSKVHGVGSRLFKREEFEEAYDNLQNREKQLAEQMRRFKLDIEGINKNRQWAIESELKKQGFDREAISEFKARYNYQREQEKAIEETKRQTIETIDEKLKKKEVEKSQPPQLAQDFEKVQADKDLETEQPSLTEEFEAAENTDEKQYDDMPEFKNEEERRIWMEFKEIEQAKENDLGHDEGMER